MSSHSQPDKNIRILIADDHLIVREGLRGMLSGQSDLAVVGEARNGEEALSLCQQLQPDIVLLDLEMPRLSGMQLLHKLSEKNLDCRPIVLTTYDSDQDISAAFSAGAYGYLLKDTPRKALFSAIRTVASGRRLSPPREHEQASFAVLSNREIDVLHLVSQGLNNETIGQQLHISKATVKTHLIHIFRKLEVDDRTSAVTEAIRRKIIRLSQ